MAARLPGEKSLSSNRRNFVQLGRLMTIACFLTALPLSAHAQLAGLPGSPFRMGFGARGIAMGNAMSAVSDGEVGTYYNPALLPFVSQRVGSLSAGILTLDRSMNTLNFSTALPPQAGFGAGIINTGVSNIDGRDNDGQPTGALRTAEDLVFLGFGLRFPAGFSLGVNLKLYYAHLYTDISSTTVGADIGFFYRVSSQVSVAATVKDISSKYRWDTSTLYGEQGRTSTDAFPRLYTIGAAYALPSNAGVVSAEVEASNQSSLTLRAGGEYYLLEEFAIRAGVDRIDLKDSGTGIRPAIGFMVRRDFNAWTPALQYTFVLEPFTQAGIHLISLSAMF